MSDNLKELIARMKQGSSQVSKPAPAPVKPEPEEDDNVLEDLEDEPEEEVKPVKVEKKPEVVQIKEEKQEMPEIDRQVLILRDDGVFRLEMLHRLNEIDNSLKVIAGVLVELSGHGKA